MTSKMDVDLHRYGCKLIASNKLSTEYFLAMGLVFSQHDVLMYRLHSERCV
jgi:hypothetical protein